MPGYLLANQCIPLSIINSAQTIIHQIFLHLNSKNNLYNIIKANKR